MIDIQAVKAPFEHLMENIDACSAKAFAGLFCDGKIAVNVPRYGQIGNNIVFERYLRQVKLWLSEREGVRFEFWRALQGEKHLALHMMIYFEINDAEFDYHKELHIPIGIVCELEGDLIRAARVYYTTYWSAGGHNITRPAMLNEDPSLVPNLPEAEKKYFQCLWNADSDTIINELFDPDAYFMTTAYSINRGADLMRVFNSMFSGGRNTELRLCTTFMAEGNLVVEYMNHRSGGNPNTPSSGMAIYGYTPEGKVAYVRLAGDSSYDHCLWPTL